MATHKRFFALSNLALCSNEILSCSVSFLKLVSSALFPHV